MRTAVILVCKRVALAWGLLFVDAVDVACHMVHSLVYVQQVVEFVKGEDYAKFTRIVFDTAPTGHTLRLLSVPDFVDAALGKIVRLRKKLGSAGDAVRGLFGASDQQDTAVEKLEKLRVSALTFPRVRGRSGTPGT
jgi:anion-transporting  ArsA/GET3 family ATPase